MTSTVVFLAATLPAAEPARADLVVEKLDPGFLCVGPGNQVVVTVANRGDGAVEVEFEVLLTVQLPGRSPATLRSAVPALPPGDRLELRFAGVEVPRPAEVLLRAEADPDLVVDDGDRTDNTLAVLVSVAGECESRRAARNHQESPPGRAFP